MKVSVIIPTYRRYGEVCSTVRDLLACRYEDFEVIVADQNADWPGPFAKAKRALQDDARLIWLSIGNVGVVNARHAAVERSTGDLLLFVDDDVRLVDRSFIALHVTNYSDPSIDAVCGRELPENADTGAPLPPGGPESDLTHLAAVEQALGFQRTGIRRSRVGAFCTCNSSVRRSSFLAVGGFDESFGGASYGDDYDFAIRLVEANGRIVFDPACVLVHCRAPLGGLRYSDKANRFSDYERSLSGLIFTLRHGRNGRTLRYLLYHWVLRRTVLLRRNVLNPWRQPMVVWGLAKAWREARRVVAHGPRSRFMPLSLSGSRPDRACAAERVGARAMSR